MAYKLIYNPLVDYIRSHVRLCAVPLYNKAYNLCYLLSVGWYTVACKPNLYICICTYDGIKIGLLNNNAGYMCCKIYRIRHSLS